ncbi:cuticle protein 10.9-like [Tachypleus tridentatus]|uniref:cuticle protein 10.9-like n=1 Tax=Tachypleus tridentatus TaxID=6853 RepID=UPI003FCF76C0
MVCKVFVLAVLVGVALAGYDGYGYADYYYPQPYQYGYEINDYYGNQQWKQENSDGYNNVIGGYGYRDAYGIWRSVRYVADGYGFRAEVSSNEPGTSNQDPAHVYSYSDAYYNY